MCACVGICNARRFPAWVCYLSSFFRSLCMHQCRSQLPVARVQGHKTAPALLHNGFPSAFALPLGGEFPGSLVAQIRYPPCVAVEACFTELGRSFQTQGKDALVLGRRVLSNNAFLRSVIQDIISVVIMTTTKSKQSAAKCRVQSPRVPGGVTCNRICDWQANQQVLRLFGRQRSCSNTFKHNETNQNESLT